MTKKVPFFVSQVLWHHWRPHVKYELRCGIMCIWGPGCSPPVLGVTHILELLIQLNIGNISDSCEPDLTDIPVLCVILNSDLI